MFAKTSGKINEYNYLKYLDGRKVKDLNNRFKELFFKLFINLEDDDIIKAYLDYGSKKYDLVVSIKNMVKRFSLKVGISNSLHVEDLSSFTTFLKDNGIPKNVIYEYLKYHFGDNTLNGTGLYRMSAKEYKTMYPEKIKYINKYFNQESLVLKVIDRFILKGRNSYFQIDAIIHGGIDDFVYLLKDDVIRLVLSNLNKEYQGVHFANLFCQAKDRNLKGNPAYEKDRFAIQIKWYEMHDDIINFYNNLDNCSKND